MEERICKIPELLTTISGEKINTVFDWEQFRREEIANLFCDYVYGRRDIERPAGQKFEVIEETEIFEMRKKVVKFALDDYFFPFYLYLPKKINRPLPAFVYVMHEGMEDKLAFNNQGNMESDQTQSVLPLKTITDRGYAVAVMPTRDIYRDWKAKANYNQGIFTVVKSQKERNKHSWATISAWAWGVSRVLDYLEREKDIDSTKIASIGHSRSGKTALYAGATDKRIFLTVTNNSGCMGSAILRTKKGEHAVDINVSDWFCEKFREYNHKEHLLPVDQHMLLAMVAPRYLYVTSSIDDTWADPDAEFLGGKLASEVYELYGLKGLVAPAKPELNKTYHDGHIAYHVKSGRHSQTAFDWEKVMDYFDKIRKDTNF